MMEPLIPILFLTVAGLVFSLLLIFASNVFKINEDSNFDNVRACLPGINCSVCGYANCDEYARGILNGDAITKCRPGEKQLKKNSRRSLARKIRLQKGLVEYKKTALMSRLNFIISREVR